MVGHLPSSSPAAPPRPTPWAGVVRLKSRITRIPVAQKLFLVQQLSIMIRTGISLAVAIKTLKDQTVNRGLRRILGDLGAEVERGTTLAKALEAHRAVFGDLFISMVAGGEASGRLEDVLQQLYEQLKRDHALMAKVRGAMIYPAVIIIAMVGVAVLTMIFVIPNLISIFQEINVPLPLATRVLIRLSRFSTRYGAYAAVFVIIGGIVLVRLLRSGRPRYAWHWLLLKLPVAGVIIQKINIARFCRTFSSLLKTDIAVVRGFEITAAILGHEHYRRLLLEAKEKVKRGTSIKESLVSRGQLFPPVVLQMIAVGEETGALDTVLAESAAFYENDLEQTMTALPTLIEPILIVLLGLGVAAMAVAVITPLYSLSQQI